MPFSLFTLAAAVEIAGLDFSGFGFVFVRWIRFWRYAVREPRETFAELKRKTNESLLPDKNNNNNNQKNRPKPAAACPKRRKNLVSTLEESCRRRRRRHRSFLPLDSLLLHQWCTRWWCTHYPPPTVSNCNCAEKYLQKKNCVQKKRKEKDFSWKSFGMKK